RGRLRRPEGEGDQHEVSGAAPAPREAAAPASVGARVARLAALAAIFAFALFLRAAIPLADPPLWLTTSHSAVIDRPWYAAVAAAAEGAPADPGAADPSGDVPASYRRPLSTAFSRLVYRAAGAGPATLALPSALAGAALAVAAYLLLARAAGRGW